MRKNSNVPTSWKIKQLRTLKSRNTKKSDNQEGYAVDEVTHAEEEVFLSATEKGRQFTKSKYIKYKQNKEKTKKDMSYNADMSSFQKVTNSNIRNYKSKTNRHTPYNPQMKNYAIQKHYHKTMKESSNSIRYSASTIKELSFKTVAIIKGTISNVSNLIGIGISSIILLVVILFIGVFSALSNDGSINAPIVPLSDEVISYSPLITEYAEQYEIPEYIPIIQAIMMHESKGLGNDPMNSSNSEYNIKFPLGITEPEYSIEIGIQTLSNRLEQSSVENTLDTSNIYLALQSYNYGKDYINWANTNFGGYTKANAKVYYDMNGFGNPYYVESVMKYVTFGFGNFRETPNFDNVQAWGKNNPYSKGNLFGQCTWFAWGRFYEIYGYSPGFTGDGKLCAKQLVDAHPDRFELSDQPKVGAIYSGINKNHVGIVIAWDGVNVTVQDGNLDGKSNSFAEAKKDWSTSTYTLSTLRSIYGGVIFASPK